MREIPNEFKKLVPLAVRGTCVAGVYRFQVP
jgi:hypothetical protein